MSKNQECLYIKPARGKEFRIFELLAEIKKKGISLKDIEIVSDPDQILLYRAAEEVYSSIRLFKDLENTGKAIMNLFRKYVEQADSY